jgi:hypothetical protein
MRCRWAMVQVVNPQVVVTALTHLSDTARCKNANCASAQPMSTNLIQATHKRIATQHAPWQHTCRCPTSPHFFHAAGRKGQDVATSATGNTQSDLHAPVSVAATKLVGAVGITLLRPIHSLLHLVVVDLDFVWAVRYVVLAGEVSWVFDVYWVGLVDVICKEEGCRTGQWPNQATKLTSLHDVAWRAMTVHPALK